MSTEAVRLREWMELIATNEVSDTAEQKAAWADAALKNWHVSDLNKGLVPIVDGVCVRECGSIRDRPVVDFIRAIGDSQDDMIRNIRADPNGKTLKTAPGDHYASSPITLVWLRQDDLTRQGDIALNAMNDRAAQLITDIENHLVK